MIFHLNGNMPMHRYKEGNCQDLYVQNAINAYNYIENNNCLSGRNQQ